VARAFRRPPRAAQPAPARCPPALVLPPARPRRHASRWPSALFV